MELTKKPLRTREMVAIIIMVIGLKGGDTTPALFAAQAQNALWLAVLVSFLFLLFPLLVLMYLLKKYEKFNLVELIFHLLGTKLGTVLSLLLFLSGFAAMSLDMRSVIEEINYLYFPQSPTIAIHLIFLVVCISVANKGLETIGSLSWALLPVISLTIFVVIYIDLREVVWQHIFPILGDGAGTLLKEGITKSPAFLEIFLIPIAYQAFHKPKFFRTGMYTGAVMSCLLILTLYLIYTMLFDYNTINNIAFLYQESTDIVLMGHFFTNISTLFMIGWLFSSFLRFIIYLYLLTWIFGATFEIKRFEGLLVPIAFISMIASLLPPSFSINELFIRDTILEMITPLLFLFPLLLWGASYWKDRKKT